MLRRILSLILSIVMIVSAVPSVSAAGAAAGQIRGMAMSQTGQHLAGQLARLRSLDIGHVADVTTTSGSGEFSFSGVGAGSYVVELVSNGYVVGTSAPVVLSPRSMTAEGVTATASSAQAQAGVLSGSFWTSTVGIIVLAAITAGVLSAVVVATNDESPSR